MQHNLCQLHCSSVGPCRHRGHDLDPIAARPRPAQESLQCLRVVAHSPGKPDQKVIISLPLPSTMLVRHRAWASKLERSPINPVIRGSVLRCTSFLASAAARASWSMESPSLAGCAMHRGWLAAAAWQPWDKVQAQRFASHAQLVPCSMNTCCIELESYLCIVRHSPHNCSGGRQPKHPQFLAAHHQRRMVEGQPKAPAGHG